MENNRYKLKRADVKGARANALNKDSDASGKGGGTR